LYWHAQLFGSALVSWNVLKESSPEIEIGWGEQKRILNFSKRNLHRLDNETADVVF
jgi:hypothetical protein